MFEIFYMFDHILVLESRHANCRVSQARPYSTQGIIAFGISGQMEWSGEFGPKLVAERNVLIVHVMMLFNHWCGLPPQFESVMTQLC